MCAQVWVGGLRNVGTKSELAAQVEVQVNLCIVVGGRLQIAGTKSAVAAQVRGRFEDTGIARECDEISSMGTAATIVFFALVQWR